MKPYFICPTCSSNGIVKNGTPRCGKQNHTCRDCDRQFVENPLKTGCKGISISTTKQCPNKCRAIVQEIRQLHDGN